MDAPLSTRSSQSLSFLDLPREIRDIIYTFSQTEDGAVRPTGQITCYHISYLGNLIRTRDSDRHPRRIHPRQCAIDGLPFGVCKPGLNMSLLFVSKQIHMEAADLFFGQREFVFVLAMTHWPPRPTYRFNPLSPGRNWVLTDNLRDIPVRYLPLSKNVRLHVHIPHPFNSTRELFRHCKLQLQNFAERFGGKHHSLQNLRVYLSNPLSSSPAENYLDDPDVTRYQNILEPLGAIHNIPNPRCWGSSPDFARKMERVMKSDTLLCVPKQQAYRTRIVKTKGRKKAQRFESDCYNDAKHDFFDSPVATRATVD